METAALKSFAVWARTELIGEVSARISVVLSSPQERQENPKAVTALEKAISAAGGRGPVAETVAYTWFNRIVALRYMDAKGYTGAGVVSPAQVGGQPEILADANRGSFDSSVVSSSVAEKVTGLLNGTRSSTDAFGEAYMLLLGEYCRYWNRSMPFMFQAQDEYTDLLMPKNLLAVDSVMARAVNVLAPEVCRDVEVIGWLYQFYISERKEEVFAGFKKKMKAGAAEIPAATQLFTPHWIVRYLVENSLGRLWLLNRPSSALAARMEYYIAPVDEETDFLKISGPEELKIIDPACGSGHMLTYAFDLLYAIYEEEGYAPSDIPALILSKNLYGTEIDPRAGALAAFALTMKARHRQRTFLTKNVQPNICVLTPVSFTPAELDVLVTSGGDRHAEEMFWNQFEHADTLGSLIQPNEALIGPLHNHLKALQQDANDLFLGALLDRATRVLDQAKYLTSRYHVAVANPPYMGSRNMVGVLADYVKREYPGSKADLFAAFISRAISLSLRQGFVGMITMQGWMFLPSFAKLRSEIVKTHFIPSMLHLGSRAFDTISGEVVGTTSFVIEVDGSVLRNGLYYQLTRWSGEAAKSEAFRGALAEGSRSPILNRKKQDVFAAVPGSPIAYWANETELLLFNSNKSVGDVSKVRAGMATGNNDKFVRFWHEVSKNRLKLDASTAEEVWESPRNKWVIFNKGGESKLWYGHVDHVLAYDSSSYAQLKVSGNHCPSEKYYFKECLTWSDVSTGVFAPRYMPTGSVLSTVGNSIYEGSMPLADLCCALASSTVSGMLSLLNPTLHANPGDVARLPVPPVGDSTVFAEAVEIARNDWHSVETSWDFQGLDYLAGSHGTRLSDAFVSSDTRWSKSVRDLAQLEADNNVRQHETFGLGPLDPTDPNSAATLDGVTLLRNFFNNGVWDSTRAHQARSIDLVSYAVGCIFGRYSLDEPGLILADQGARLDDYLARVPSPSFMPDKDNVIPIVDGEWFQDDIVARFRQFLRVAFGEEHFEENLRFVTESLGVKDLRDYFVKSFYKDHVQRYKKRPIYWLFSSPKGSFNALIYMHRYSSSTPSTVLNEYLREFKAKLEASREHHDRIAASADSAREKSAALKEVDRLRRILIELDEYEHDVLFPIASRRPEELHIDLDDGVKANYPKLGAALKKIPGLETNDG